MELASNVRHRVSFVPLLADLAQLGERPHPTALVDFAVGHKMIRPLQNRSELVDLARIVAAARPSAMLEIGAVRGGTLFVFSRLAARDATIISVDLPRSPMARVYRAAQRPLFRKLTRDQQTLHMLRRDSNDPFTRAQVTRILDGRRLDFLFIDGDHGYANVRTDFERYSPLVRPGGVVAFHAVTMGPPSGVARFWEEVKRRHRNTEIVHDRAAEATGIGVLWM
jgi:predicted O-methyltransferase YrrM